MLSGLKRIVVLVACCWFAAAPSLALAEGQGPDPKALGITEAMLDYCSKAYPESTVKYQYQVTRLTQGASAEALAKVRGSAQYRQAHDAEGDFVSKVDPRNAKRVCGKSTVAGK
jgi:hypothetical protein